MQAGRTYRLYHTLRWQWKAILVFILFDTLVVAGYHFLNLDILHIPWQPISLIGIAVAFYLGFKNNSSYDRLWEGRKIWGGIVNASRSFAVMTVSFINNDEAEKLLNKTELDSIKKRVIHRHVAWLHTLALQLRKIRPWEHDGPSQKAFRTFIGTHYDESKFEMLSEYIDAGEFNYIMSKGNRASHLLNSQTKDLMELRRVGVLEHFRHLEMQGLITEFYTLQGKAERIKNFPFPRQYATINYYFVVLFIFLLPFGMLDVFVKLNAEFWIWLSIPFSVVASWVFWMMERIGDFSENPFEGLHNDVPITSMARGIEIDIRQMLDEDNIPDPIPIDPVMKIQI